MEASEVVSKNCRKGILSSLLVRQIQAIYREEGKLDLLNIVMIGLAKELPAHDEGYELHRLLGALLSKELTVDEKLTIMDTEYDIPIERDFREDVSLMCNLSQGIKEDGIEIGKEIGKEIGEAKLIITMYHNGFTPQQIADATDKKLEEIERIIKGREPAMT